MQPDFQEATLSRLPLTRQAILDGIAQRLHLGAQLYVSRRGEIWANGAVGENRPGETLSARHAMLWLSATKPVAAVAIAQLWEQGLLELDDAVAHHLPAFGVQGKEAITLRHLLTHTAGIRLLKLGWPEDSWDTIVERVSAMRPEPRWSPGQKAGYHHASSWFVLGEIVRRLSGRPFSRYVQEEIFQPLGMAEASIGMSRERYRALQSEGLLGVVWNTEGSSEPLPQGWDSEAWATGTNPAANGYGPMADLGRFYEALLQRGTLGGSRILSAQSVEALSARHRAGMFDHTFRHVLDWGLGFIINSNQYGAATVPYGYGSHASPRAFGHSGYRSVAAFADPEHGVAVALAFNGTPRNEDHEQRLRSVLDAIYVDLGLAAEATLTPA